MAQYLARHLYSVALLVPYALDVGFSESCFLHWTPLVHPVEKTLFPPPLMIGGITGGLHCDDGKGPRLHFWAI